MSRPKVQAGGIVKRKNPEDRRSALSVEWRTPEPVLELVRIYCGGPIPLDVATSKGNPTRALRFLTPGKRCGLRTSWAAELDQLPGSPRVAWGNVPYGEHAQGFYEKAAVEARADRTLQVLYLLPYNRSETRYMQESILAEACAEWHPRGRLAFIGESGVAGEANPFASILYGLNVDVDRFAWAFGRMGLVRATRVVRAR